MQPVPTSVPNRRLNAVGRTSDKIDYVNFRAPAGCGLSVTLSAPAFVPPPPHGARGTIGFACGYFAGCSAIRRAPARVSHRYRLRAGDCSFHCKSCARQPRSTACGSNNCPARRGARSVAAGNRDSSGRCFQDPFLIWETSTSVLKKTAKATTFQNLPSPSKSCAMDPMSAVR